MISNAKKRNVFIVLLALLSIYFFLSGAFFAKNNEAEAHAQENGFVLSSELPTDISKGDSLSVPQGKFGDAEATAYVIAPDGSVYVGDTVKLQKHGTYRIQYSAVVDGEVLLHEETFTIENTAHGFNDERSTAEYVENAELAKRDGLLVDLVQGDTFTFNQAIDLNEFSREDAPVKFTIIPQKEGSFDVKAITLTFTDLYDSDNKAEIKYFFEENETSYWNRCLARANDQTWKGWDNTQAVPKLWVNTYGTYYNFYPKDNFSYNGNEANNILATQYLGAHIDVDTNEMLYASYAFRQNLDVCGSVVDLDDNSYQDKLFKGFTTGEVIVSVKCESYAVPSAQLLFLRLGNADLTVEKVSDDNAPTIVLSENVDTQSYGVVGGSFPVPDAVGLDGESDGYVNVKTRVYYEYERDNGIYHTVSENYTKEISVVNGRFKTEKAGKYSICYSASDYNENYTERVINVAVVEVDASITDIYLRDGYLTAIESGNLIKLAVVEDYEGGYRNLGGRDDVAIDYAIDKDGKNVEYSGNEIVGYSFIPNEAGIYTVSITLTDYVGTKKTVTYDIEATKQVSPAFDKTIDLPKYIIEGAEYVLPDAMGKNANGTETKASVTINDGNGLRKYTSGSKTTFLADRRGNAEITYSLNTNKQSFSIPVIALREGKTIDASKYFVGENFEATVEQKGVLLNFSGDSDVTFINSLLDEVFNVTFELGGFGENFTEFSICLTDSIDISEKVEMTFLYNGVGVDVYVNGEMKQRNFINVVASASEISVGWDVNTDSWLIGTSSRLEVVESVYGLPFDGFTSRKVYMDFSVKNNGTEASILVKKIVNQDMGSISKSDNRQPELIIEGEFNELLREHGSVLELFSAVGGDVLSPYCSVTVTVEFNYQTVTAMDGTELRDADCSNRKTYQLPLTEYGVYTITYKTTDWNYRTKSLSLLMKVEDFEPPILTVNNDYEVKNGVVTLSEISATDNHSETVAIYITAFTPSGKIVYIKDNTFVAEEKGDYILSIMAMDEFGNCTEVQSVITVD